MRTISTPDGHTLAVYEGGAPAGRPVVVQHGTPGSGVPYGPHETLAHEQGIRLIAYSRPGYDASTRRAGRTVADCAADVDALATALGLERYATWGISGGGPHALACAALCDERLVAVASLAAVAPYAAEGLDWTAGMGEVNIQEFGATLAGEQELRPFLERDAAELAAAPPDQLVAVWETLLGPEDRAVMSEDLARFLLESMGVGLANGVDGWLDDDFAFAQPWDFDLARIDRPVLILHGADDRFVPVAHGRWLAERIPGVEARIEPRDGHLTLAERRVREAHEWLLARL
jgi:pimeloyl-ACP methyl ester carboxylesterase